MVEQFKLDDLLQRASDDRLKLGSEHVGHRVVNLGDGSVGGDPSVPSFADDGHPIWQAAFLIESLEDGVEGDPMRLVEPVDSREDGLAIDGPAFELEHSC